MSAPGQAGADIQTSLAPPSAAGEGGVFVVSLDLELYWGSRDRRGLEASRERLAGTRRVVPRILELFRRYEIHATWATVGLLFCDSVDEAVRSAPACVPSYEDRNLSPYPDLAAMTDDEPTRALLFAPELIRQILDTPHQELATHTYSHYYCVERGQGAEEFRQDLRAALDVAERKCGKRLVSIVFPRNQVSDAYLRICAEEGILAYRGNEHRWFWASRSRGDDTLLRRALRLADAYVPLSGPGTYPAPAGEERPVNLAASHFLRPYSPWLGALEPLRLRRIAAALRDAAHTGRIFHLWWHPENFGVRASENLAFLEKVLARVAALRRDEGLRCLAMGELTGSVTAEPRPRRASGPSPGGSREARVAT